MSFIDSAVESTEIYFILLNYADILCQVCVAYRDFRLNYLKGTVFLKIKMCLFQPDHLQ